MKIEKRIEIAMYFNMIFGVHNIFFHLVVYIKKKLIINESHEKL